jgi:hypothetical protein
MHEYCRGLEYSYHISRFFVFCHISQCSEQRTRHSKQEDTEWRSYNENSEDDLIPESDSSESSDNERPESPDISMISDVANEATPETSPRHCSPLPRFKTKAGLNTNIQNTDVMSFVSLFIANSCLRISVVKLTCMPAE